MKSKFYLINNLNTTKYSILFVFVFSFVSLPISYFFSKFGLDLSDTGFFLYSQTRISLNSLNESGPSFYWIGSDLLGSKWLDLIGKPSLQLARFGAYLIHIIIFIIIHFSLVNIYGERVLPLILTFLTYFLFGSVNLFPIINYDLVPLLPVSLIFLILTNITYQKNRNYLNYFTIGSLSFLVIYSRFTLALFVFILFFILSEDNKHWNSRRFLALITGFIFVQLSLYLFSNSGQYLLLFYETILNTFLKLIAPEFPSKGSYSLIESNNYKISDQLFYWFRGYLRIILIVSLSFFTYYFSVKYLSSFYKKIILYILFAGLLVFVILPFDNSFVLFGLMLNNIQSQFLNIYLVSGLIITILLLSLRYTKNLKDDRTVYFFLITLFLLFPVGSNSFEKKLPLTFPLVAPSLILLYRKSELQRFRFDKALSSFLISITKITILPIFILTLRNYTNFPYRDYNIFNLDYAIESVGFENIKTSNNKAVEVRQLVTWLVKNKKEDEKVLCLGQCSMFNYILQQDGVFDYPWPTYLDINYFRDKLNETFQSNEKIGAIILPLFNIENSSWKKIEFQNYSNDPHIKYILDLVKEGRYHISYKSNYFLVLKPLKRG